MTCPDLQVLDSAWSQLREFTSHLDLVLDQRKTYMWSILNSGRKELKRAGFSVKQSGKVFSAHVQMSSRHTNQTVVLRIQSLGQLWPKLRFSLSPYHLKSRAIRVAAWPKGLHGIEATTVSFQAFVNLRSNAMKGLHADGPGCNPNVRLGLIEPMNTDPHFWTILQTLRTVRACGDCSQVRSMLVQVSHGLVDVPNNSVTHTIFARLQMLSWTVRQDGSLEDIIGTFDLFTVSFPELKIHAELAWQHCVATAVEHRTCFDGLRYADVGETRSFLQLLDPQDAGAFRKLLNGAEFTADAAQRWNVHDDAICPNCACEDSRYHRHWQCDTFAEARQTFGSDVLQLVPGLPHSLKYCGWAVRPASWIEWLRYLPAVPTPDVGTFRPLEPGPDGRCVFGSCQTTCCICSPSGRVFLRCSRGSVDWNGPCSWASSISLSCGTSCVGAGN